MSGERLHLPWTFRNIDYHDDGGDLPGTDRWHRLRREIEHGTYGAYVTKRCRCDQCRAAAAAYQARRRSRQKQSA